MPKYDGIIDKYLITSAESHPKYLSNCTKHTQVYFYRPKAKSKTVNVYKKQHKKMAQLFLSPPHQQQKPTEVQFHHFIHHPRRIQCSKINGNTNIKIELGVSAHAPVQFHSSPKWLET